MLIIALSVSAGIAAITLVVLWQPWKMLSKNTLAGQKLNYKVRKATSRIAVSIYKKLSRFFITRVYMINLAEMFRHMYVLDEEAAKVKAVSLIMKEILIGIGALLFSLWYFNDTLLALIMTYMVMAYAYFKMKGDGQKFLEELEESISDMVHMYNASGKNIDRMFEKILEDQHSYMHKYMEQMYTYLKKAILSSSGQQVISEYNSLVASRHLRLIFNYLYITYRYGDEVNARGEQLFDKNMLAIQREVHMDYIKIKRIKDETIGEQWFIILAVGMIPAATWYMNTFFTFDGFESISRFLNSSLGYMIKVICAVVALITYYVYLKLMESNSALESYKSISWEENILNKHSWLKRFIDKISPKPGTERRERLESAVRMTEGYSGIRPLYLRKIISSLIITIAVALMLSVDTYTNYTTIMGDFYTGVNREYMDTVTSLAEFPDRYKADSLSNDTLVIDILNENKEEYFNLQTQDERELYIRQIIRENGIDYGQYPEIAATRIAEKYVLLGKINPWVISLIVLAAFIGAYTVPTLAIELKVLLNRGAIIYDEVNGCYTVVVLLINHSASNIYMLMGWLTSFTNLLKSRLQACVDNLSSKSINELGKTINYKPFKRLVDCIQLAYDGADFKSAFAGIEQRHLFQEESRRIVTEQIISKRIAYSQVLSWIAMGTTFCLYIVAPMIWSICEMLFQLL